MDRLHGIDQRALDRLLDPPRCIGGEPRALCWIKPFDRADEADVALFNEIREREPSVDVIL